MAMVLLHQRKAVAVFQLLSLVPVCYNWITMLMSLQLLQACVC